MIRKGILLAGGSGTRLFPATRGISKQLLPIFDKPMVYYPLTVLMLAGIREIAVITTPRDRDQFERVLGDGSQWGLALSYIEQPSPDGLAQAYLLAEDFLAGAASAMVLGDNLFFGNGVGALLDAAAARETGGTVFGYRVSDPERYGVLGFDAEGRVTEIVEKPEVPPSNYAVTGLYFLDGSAPQRARAIRPSARGELEITDLLASYLDEGGLMVETMRRGFAWLDTGTHESLLNAAQFVGALQQRQGIIIASPEEIAFRAGWIDAAQLVALAGPLKKSDYGHYLLSLLEEG